MKKEKAGKFYETMIIWDAALQTEELDKEITKVTSIIEKSGGECLKIDNWGKRRLAYEIKKKKEGVYVVIDFSGKPNILTDLFDHFKFDKNVLRHIALQKSEPEIEIKADSEETEDEGSPISEEEN